MAGVISDIQQICDWIVYLKDIHDTIKGNRHRCQHLSTRCQQFESYLNNLDHKNETILKGVLLVHSSIRDCVDFIDKYGKTGVMRSMKNVAFSKSIESDFQVLNASLTQAANDLQFGIIVSSKTSSDLRDLVARSNNRMESHDSGRDSGSDSSKKMFEKVQFTKIDRSALDWDNRKFIGKGSFAHVYSCLYGGKPYAVKHFENFHLLSDSQLRTVRREVRILQLTKHENIISFVGFSVDDGMLVCDLAQGTLHDVLYKDFRFEGIVNPDKIQVKVNWLLDIAQALCYLHHHGIIHRDIKPLNTLIVVDTTSKKAILKIADFGIASMMGVTMGTMTTAGSPLYVAPEVIGATSTIDTYTSAVDMYSFGILANELFTAEPPWKGCNFWQIMDGVRSGMRPKRFENDDEELRALKDLVGDASAGCLCTIPTDRPSSFEAVNELIILSERCHSRFDDLKNLADEGDAHFQCQLGLCYWVGSGELLTNNIEILDIYTSVVSMGWLEDVNSYTGIKNISSNYDEAFKYFKRSADQDNALAQFFVGKCYLVGQGIDNDSVQSLHYFQKSALQCNAAGLNAIGCCYFQGHNADALKAFETLFLSRHGIALSEVIIFPNKSATGFTVDKLDAFKYYKLAADQGYAAAQFNVGVCYVSGVGVAVDKVEAFKFFKLAADQGYITAQFKVGWCYANGSGVETNNVEAFQYYKLAADQGYAAAQNNIGFCYGTGNGVEMDVMEAFRYYKMAADQDHVTANFNVAFYYDKGIGVESDKVEAFKHYKFAADRGHVTAQNNIACFYSIGWGVVMDKISAFKYYRMAADHGDVDSQFKVGWCFSTGEGVTLDKKESFKYYKLSADQGHVTAQYNVGNCYRKGEGIKMDETEAFKYFKLAADQGHAAAQFRVGCCFDEGDGVTLDKIESFRYYKLSADQGHATALYKTGCCFSDGSGVEANNEEAYKYYKLAANQGHVDAHRNLKR